MRASVTLHLLVLLLVVVINDGVYSVNSTVPFSRSYKMYIIDMEGSSFMMLSSNTV